MWKRKQALFAPLRPRHPGSGDGGGGRTRVLPPRGPCVLALCALALAARLYLRSSRIACMRPPDPAAVAAALAAAGEADAAAASRQVAPHVDAAAGEAPEDDPDAPDPPWRWLLSNKGGCRLCRHPRRGRCSPSPHRAARRAWEPAAPALPAGGPPRSPEPAPAPPPLLVPQRSSWR
jgi:hypothetical protein